MDPSLSQILSPLCCTISLEEQMLAQTQGGNHDDFVDPSFNCSLEKRHSTDSDKFK